MADITIISSATGVSHVSQRISSRRARSSASMYMHILHLPAESNAQATTIYNRCCEEIVA